MKNRQDLFYHAEFPKVSSEEGQKLPSHGFKDILQLHDFWLIESFSNTESIRLKVREMESKGAKILSLESTPCWESRKWQVIIQYEIMGEVPL